MAWLLKRDFLLLCLSGIFSVARTSVCEDNRNARSLIGGDNSNAVNNFIQFLRSTNTFLFFGDNDSHDRSCRRTMQPFIHRKDHLENETMWILDCWEPVECLLVPGQIQGTSIHAVPRTWTSTLNNLLSIRVNAVLLPIDQHNTITYTFLPQVPSRSALFVTSMLSGCSVFVATAGNINCNIIVMHSNRRCRHNEPEDDDDNHKQAMFVLENVHSVDQRCRYQINRRWAVDFKSENIDRHNYQYPTVYYRMSVGYNFFYGYNLGGNNRRWQFCKKELDRAPLREICHEI